MYFGTVAERRVWIGPGAELSFAAVMEPDGGTYVEVRAIRHNTDTPPTVTRFQPLSRSEALRIAERMHNLIAHVIWIHDSQGDSGAGNIVHKVQMRSNRAAVCFKVALRPNEPFLEVRWTDPMEDAIAFSLPLHRAFEVPSALWGATYVAIDNENITDGKVWPHPEQLAEPLGAEPDEEQSGMTPEGA